MKRIKFYPLFEKDEWKTIKRFEKEKIRAKKTAAKTPRKNVRINRLSSSDIFNINV